MIQRVRNDENADAQAWALPIARRIVGSGFLAAVAAVSSAQPATGVTPTVLARGTYDSFKVKSDPGSPVDLKVKAKASMDVVVRRHDYGVGANTGWHQHPGPIFITVTQGQLTYYEYDDPTCAPHVVTAGHGFVDTGDHRAERVRSARAGRECHLRTGRRRFPHRTGRSWTVL
jgi:hypothetical protein